MQSPGMGRTSQDHFGKRVLAAFIADRSGGTAIEYGLLCLMISGFIGAIIALGDGVKTTLFEVVAKLF